jgi:DNA-binding SARP family transcriptional activator
MGQHRGSAVEFHLLGPVAATHDGRNLDLGRRRTRHLLGLLLLRAGTVIRADRLTQLLWDDEPPPSARASLRTHVARLRRLLDPAVTGPTDLRPTSRDGGYVIDLDPRLVDAHRFRSMVDSARAVPDHARRSAQLRAALALWRGPLLADVASSRLRDRIASDLSLLRLTATELAVDADLAHGRHRDLIPELTELTAEYPLREEFAGQLMLAYYRCGMQAEALEAFHRIRRQLADDLGTDPGPRLQRLHRAILRREPGLDLAADPAHGPQAIATCQ